MLLLTPYPLKGTESKLATSPMPSRGPKRGRNGYITPAFSGVPNKGTISELATSPLPSRGPKRGRNGCITPAFLGVPKIRGGSSAPLPLPLPYCGPKPHWVRNQMHHL